MYPGKRRSRLRGNASDKLWLAGLVVASVALLVLSRNDAVISRVVVNNAADLAAPVLKLISGPVGRVRLAVSNAGSYAYLVDEVARLRRENARLRSLSGKVEELGNKVRRYEALLHVTPPPQVDFVTARVIGDAGSPFVRTALIDAGTDSGITMNRPVVDSRGLVGRTISAGNRAARVLLLTDLNSRVPVRVEPDGYRAVLAGNNSDFPTLEFLPIGATLQEGDRVVTSGHGGLFPAGLPVGTVETADNGKFRVALGARAEYLEFVQVLEPAPVGDPEPGEKPGDAPAAGTSQADMPRAGAPREATPAAEAVVARVPANGHAAQPVERTVAQELTAPDNLRENRAMPQSGLNR